MNIDDTALNITGNKLGYPRSVMRKIITAYLTALASQEGAQGDTTPKRCPCGSAPGECGLENCHEGAQAPDWQLAVARQNVSEKLAVAIDHGSATLSVGWLRGLSIFLDGVTTIPTKYYDAQEGAQAAKPTGSALPIAATPPIPDDAVRAAAFQEVLDCRTFNDRGEYAGWNITKLNRLVGNDGRFPVGR